MSVTFIHTADWHVGKPFARVEDDEKRARLKRRRLDVIEAVGQQATECRAAFVVVAGDLFDSPTVSNANVSELCGAVGRIGVPVYVIPGNHDHGGPGSVWERPRFLEECAHLAPNLQVLLVPEPVELEVAVLLPCPLLRRHETADPTGWVARSGDVLARYGEKPRIVIAHGSVQGFTSATDDEDGAVTSPNELDLTRLPDAELDYVGLGDWHGTKQVGPKAWYSGTPERDQFPKGGEHDPGNVLAVTVERGAFPAVRCLATSLFGWYRLSHTFHDDAGVEELDRCLGDLFGKRVGEDLLRIEVDGHLGISAMRRFDLLLDKWRERLIRLRLVGAPSVAPTDEEIATLAQRPDDPVVAAVARRLVDQTHQGGDAAEVARLALLELHAVLTEV